MIPGYLLFAIFCTVLYAATRENRQVAATASALREIWSGGCRLSCRRSECSGLSGLGAGAAPALSAAHVAHAAHAAHARDCICEYCPCAVIDTVLRSCRPATTAYSNTLDAIAEFYCSILKTINDLYQLLRSALECRVSCQRQAQLMNVNSLDSEENFNFDDAQSSDRRARKDNLSQRESTIEKFKKKLSSVSKFDLNVSKSALDTKKSTTSAASAKDSKSNIRADKGIKIGKKTSKERQAAGSQESTDTSAATSSTSSCPRCIEKGKVCMSGCPRANAIKK